MQERAKYHLAVSYFLLCSHASVAVISDFIQNFGKQFLSLLFTDSNALHDLIVIFL